MILVTGGAGFIGAHFIKAVLAQTSFSVVNIDVLSVSDDMTALADCDNSRYQFINGDIADQAFVSQQLQRFQPIWVVNFAAQTHVDRSIDGPAAFIHSNVVGTFSLLEAARRYYLQLPDAQRAAFRFLQVSTDEVFGDIAQDAGASDEFARYQPSSPYAASKAAADHLAMAWHRTYQMPILLSRCSNNYGAFQYPEKLIPLVINRALLAQSIPVYGDGLQQRDWLAVADHVQALLLILKRGKVGESFNIATGVETSNLTLVKMICQILQRHVEAMPQGVAQFQDLIQYVEDRPGHDRRYAVDASKIRNLGWQPKINLEQGITETVLWYLSNHAWSQRVLGEHYQLQRLGRASVVMAGEQNV